MGKFIDKVVLVTVGQQGTGLFAAREFAREGAKVVVAGQDAKMLAAAAEFLGPDALALQADVSQQADLDQLFSTIHEKHGRIDMMLANAA